MPEKLMACMECKHLLLSSNGYVQLCGNTDTDGERFDAMTATVFHVFSPLVALVNTDGHCPHFEAKP